MIKLKHPLVSVVLPCYNIEEYLNECLESIVNQTYQNLQIIIVNDGSTDGTTNIIDDYRDKDDRIMVINQVNSGLGAARNSGIEYVTGDYLTFVDSDDYLANDAIASSNFPDRFN